LDSAGDPNSTQQQLLSWQILALFTEKIVGAKGDL